MQRRLVSQTVKVWIQPRTPHSSYEQSSWLKKPDSPLALHGHAVECGADGDSRPMDMVSRGTLRAGRGPHLQGAEASKEKTTASLLGSSAEGARRRVAFCRFTALRMVEVWDSSWAGWAGLCPLGAGACWEHGTSATELGDPQAMLCGEEEPGCSSMFVAQSLLQAGCPVAGWR